MKKTVSILLFVILAMTLFPLGAGLLANLFDHRIIIFSVEALGIIMAGLSISLALVMSGLKEKVTDPLVNILFAIIVPCALVNSVYLIICGSIKWLVSIGVIIHIVVLIYCMLRMGKASRIRAIVTIVVLLLTLPILVMCLLRLVVGPIAKNTIVDTIESPVSDYYAEVVSGDHGGLGGNTYVQVYEGRGLNLLLFRIQREPQRVYTGKLKEHENITVYWNDQDNLVINSQVYEIE